MDSFRENDVERTRCMSADERMRMVFDTVNVGIRIQLATLRARHPGASEDELVARLRRWLSDERTNA